MIEVKKLEVKDLQKLASQKPQLGIDALLETDRAKAIESDPYSYTIMSGEKVLLCGGVTQYWPNRAEAWAIMDEGSTSEFIQVHRAVKKFLDSCTIKRIEAAVDVDFEAGHRWAELLGFELEAECLKAYLPNGRDCSLYARVRE